MSDKHANLPATTDPKAVSAPDKKPLTAAIMEIGADRETLKYHFRDGARPTSQEYEALITSMVNKYDDGFRKSLRDGFVVSAAGTQKALMSFLTSEGDPPAWRLNFGDENGLELNQGLASELNGAAGDAAAKTPQSALAAPSLSLSKHGPVGVNVKTPRYRLDVNGPVRMTGRVGHAMEVETPPIANGEWWDVTGVLEGCQALEIMAGVGGKVGKGHYALLHAIALNTYNPRNWFANFLFGRRKIKSHSAFFGRRSDRLRLRWLNVGDRKYKLQIKTSGGYGKHDGNAYVIRCHVTRLWYDANMDGSRGSDDFTPDPDLI